MTMIIPNLLLIAGTGTKSGKTTLACKIIKQFRNLNITAIKISPHFHETTPGLVSIVESKGYAIYEETDSTSSKDTSRMLNAGASKVFFAKVWDDQLVKVFNEINDMIPSGTPVICESPALRNFIEPGVFIIMTSLIINKHKNISHLQTLPHLVFELEKLGNAAVFPFCFENSAWIYLPSCPLLGKLRAGSKGGLSS
jgi:hypothetical protein